MHCILKYLRSTVNWGKDESLICIGNAGLEGLFLKLSSAPWCEEQTAITSSWGHVLSKISSLVVDFWCWKLRVQSNILHRQYRCIHETIYFLKSVLSNHMEHAHVIVLPYLESTWEVWVKKQCSFWFSWHYPFGARLRFASLWRSVTCGSLTCVVFPQWSTYRLNCGSI